MSYLDLLQVILTFFFFSSSSLTSCLADVRNTKIRSKDQTPQIIDTFEFTKTGQVELNLSHISFSNPNPTNLSRMGIYLIPPVIPRYSFFPDRFCFLESDLVILLYTLEHKQTVFSISKPDEYNLFFQNCLPGIHVSMDIHSAMYNLDTSKERNYLSSGKQNLFMVYPVFITIYLSFAAFWNHQLRADADGKHNPPKNHMEIHHVMLLFPLYKLIIYFMDCMQLHYIKHVGLSQSVISVFFTWVTAVFGDLVPLYLFLGFMTSGWPFLIAIPKDDIHFVFTTPLVRLLGNLVMVLVATMWPNKFAESGLFTTLYMRLFLDSYLAGCLWYSIECTTKYLLHAGQFEGKAALVFRKVKMFRKLLVVLICHPILNVALMFFEYAVIGYAWTGVLVMESRMLLVYISVVCIFWPLVWNQILLSIDDEEEKIAAEALKDWETYDLENILAPGSSQYCYETTMDHQEEAGVLV